MAQINRVFILLGKPGSGKGSFVALLSKVIRDGLFVSDTGSIFRANLKKRSILSRICFWIRDVLQTLRINAWHQGRIKQVNDAGMLQPAALAIAMWVSNFLKNYAGEGTIIIDGSPRRIQELYVLHQFIVEYFGATPEYIRIEVSDETAIGRMQERHKRFPRPETDSLEKINKRLAQYYELNYPIFEIIKKNAWSFKTITNDGTPEVFETQVYNL
jgi:adenylate kinase family enzyme